MVLMSMNMFWRAKGSPLTRIFWHFTRNFALVNARVNPAISNPAFCQTSISIRTRYRIYTIHITTHAFGIIRRYIYPSHNGTLPQT